MKKRLLLLLLFFSTAKTFSQSCKVQVAALQGQYTGACKNGKAEGIGTATGLDSYTGNFKNGYPEGEGKYTWKNGSWYNGNWEKGLFEGNGVFNKIELGAPDSSTLITGFWHQGKYMGKYQKPYSVTALTTGISEINTRKTKIEKPEITIFLKSITAGGSSLYNALLPKPRLVKIDLIEGRFEQQVNNETSTLSNNYILRKVTFPFAAIFTFETSGTNTMPLASEKIMVELTESCSWNIRVDIDN